MNDTAPIVSCADRPIGSLSADRRWITVAIVRPSDGPRVAAEPIVVGD